MIIPSVTSSFGWDNSLDCNAFHLILSRSRYQWRVCWVTYWLSKPCMINHACPMSSGEWLMWETTSSSNDLSFQWGLVVARIRQTLGLSSLTATSIISRWMTYYWPTCRMLWTGVMHISQYVFIWILTWNIITVRREPLTLTLSRQWNEQALAAIIQKYLPAKKTLKYYRVFMIPLSISLFSKYY